MNEEPTNTWVNVTQSPDLVMKMLLIQKREGYIEAFQAVKKQNLSGATVDGTRTGSWIAALTADMCGMLSIEDPSLLAELINAMNTLDVNIHWKAFLNLSIFLYKKKLTKWDLYRHIDQSNIDDVFASQQGEFR